MNSFICRNLVPKGEDGGFLVRPLEEITHIIVHRIGKKLGPSVPDIVKSFADTSEFAAGSYTGGKMPYTFILDEEGGVWQTLEVGDVGWHAKRWSKPGVGIACVGDFRKYEPTFQQSYSLSQLCTLLGYWLSDFQLVGHTELPEASSDPEKKCPGHLLDMDELRSKVAVRIEDMQDLNDHGREMVLRNYGIML